MCVWEGRDGGGEGEREGGRGGWRRVSLAKVSSAYGNTDIKEFQIRNRGDGVQPAASGGLIALMALPCVSLTAPVAPARDMH